MKRNVAILISGRGSNMNALIAAAGRPDYPARIVGVISNRVNAPGLEAARNHGIPTAVHVLADHDSKTATDAAITKTLEGWNTQIVCLAGFMRILGDEFTRRWQNRLINIHPSLLPRFKGLDTHRRALEAGEKLHGCSVHFVIPELDAGPVIAQSKVPVLPGDTARSLEERVLRAEHDLYPRALEKLCRQADTI